MKASKGTLLAAEIRAKIQHLNISEKEKQKLLVKAMKIIYNIP